MSTAIEEQPHPDSNVIDTTNVQHKVNKKTKREQVNQYELLQRLGSGAYGYVMLCRDVQNPTQFYAMKVMNKTQLAKKKGGGAASQSVLEDIKREIVIMKKLNHQNIVKLYEVIDDSAQDNLYLVMEYLPGGPCMKRDDPTLQEATCRSYMRDIVQGLEYCHDI
ncbi:MAG: putative Serine Threonine protein kinase [Streblomastix strix]|uniref:Putative Serine Threonine protein kinase n=1 Tax=Streblomastix strix TaxID=222440 RepID=A0A5J4UUD9_9EUKA|nr:MAG: putative Serine Threonine protein kinase [Streblomastix strix]